MTGSWASSFLNWKDVAESSGSRPENRGFGCQDDELGLKPWSSLGCLGNGSMKNPNKDRNSLNLHFGNCQILISECRNPET